MLQSSTLFYLYFVDFSLNMAEMSYQDEKICSFPSKEFYSDELKTDISVKQRVNRHEPIVFRHVEGEEAEDDVKSKFNIREVDAVVRMKLFLTLTS